MLTHFWCINRSLAKWKVTPNRTCRAKAHWRNAMTITGPWHSAPMCFSSTSAVTGNFPLRKGAVDTPEVG
eukprot:7007242-Pyramimonas_sp.AAC.1